MVSQVFAIQHRYRYSQSPFPLGPKISLWWLVIEWLSISVVFCLVFFLLFFPFFFGNLIFANQWRNTLIHVYTVIRYIKYGGSKRPYKPGKRSYPSLLKGLPALRLSLIKLNWKSVIINNLFLFFIFLMQASLMETMNIGKITASASTQLALREWALRVHHQQHQSQKYCLRIPLHGLLPLLLACTTTPICPPVRQPCIVDCRATTSSERMLPVSLPCRRVTVRRNRWWIRTWKEKWTVERRRSTEVLRFLLDYRLHWLRHRWVAYRRQRKGLLVSVQTWWRRAHYSAKAWCQINLSQTPLLKVGVT